MPPHTDKLVDPFAYLHRVPGLSFDAMRLVEGNGI